MVNIGKNIRTIKQLIANYELKYARTPGSVKLLAASKGQPLEKIDDALHAGQRLFGENYVQEALPKIAAVEHEKIEVYWHFIGKLQSNKCTKICAHFPWVETVDNMKIAKRLNDHMPDALPPLNICIEVNISGEASKSGVRPQELLYLAEYCVGLPRLKLRGLMCIPAYSEDFVTQRKSFEQMRLLFEDLQKHGFEVDTLSMGMSGDFEAAIAEGSTCVRVGTGIFGARPEVLLRP